MVFAAPAAAPEARDFGAWCGRGAARLRQLGTHDVVEGTCDGGVMHSSSFLRRLDAHGAQEVHQGRVGSAEVVDLFYTWAGSGAAVRR